MGPSGTAITPPGPSPSPAACATAAAAATAAGSVAISTGMLGVAQRGLDLARGDAAGGDVVEVAAAAVREQQARSAAHGLAHAQLEHACRVADLALARHDDQVGVIELGDGRLVGRERVPVGPANPLLTSAPPPAARTSSAQACASSLLCSPEATTAIDSGPCSVA